MTDLCQDDRVTHANRALSYGLGCVKRVSGDVVTVKFDRDERGTRTVRRADLTVAATAPRRQGYRLITMADLGDGPMVQA